MESLRVDYAIRIKKKRRENMVRIDGFTRLHPQKNTERITQATKSSRWLQQAKGRTTQSSKRVLKVKKRGGVNDEEVGGQYASRKHRKRDRVRKDVKIRAHSPRLK
jgi:hypothetical protein